MVSSLVDTISIKYYFKHSFTKSHDRGIIQKKSPHWGEYQFLSRLKSQVSLARYYEEKDSYLIVFVDLETEEKLSAPFSQKLYDAMFQIYGQEIRNSEKPDVIVDENWARQFLEKSRQEPHQES